jgi:hypothetical protein
MSKLININNEQFYVESNEYNNIQKRFSSLKIYENLGLHERLISLIDKLKNIENIKNLIILKCSHGGFIPIKLSPKFDKIYLVKISENNLINIKKNSNYYNIHNIIFVSDNDNLNGENIIFIPENIDNLEQNFIIDKYFNNNIIVLSQESKIFDKKFKFKYLLTNTNYCIYLDDKNKNFIEIFKYYVDKNILNYDNLINLCVMVKNGGENFKNFLKSNINLIDKWTILDTGSTDNTIKIIYDILVGKKDGELYQEPFINFRDSRNRLLDLAGNVCKFIVMLDDTYIVKGDLREFLNFVRGDQYSSSFSIYIDNNDIKYSSNRILKSSSNLRYIYKIHEVINDKNNIIVNIPYNQTNIIDDNPEYMKKRTYDRLLSDLKLLYEELEDDPNNPRTYYYLGQTYNLLGDYYNSYNFFLKRYEFKNSGFIQERFSAILRAARIANFNLNLEWKICEDLYFKANKIDESRPEPLYFIGANYYLKNNYSKAFYYFKKAFELGVPEDSQFDLIDNIYCHYLPKFLSKISYDLNEFEIGEKSSEFFINYDNNKTTPDYKEIFSWNQIYKKLNIYKEEKKIKTYPTKPIFCFLADGGFNQWSGSNILTDGVGGSETYIIEMARNIQKSGIFQTYVFSNTPNGQEEIFEGTIYKPITSYYDFINTTYVHHCMISRFSEYLPLTFKGFAENIYFVIHDLLPSGNVIPIDYKLKQIFCLTEWHVEYFIKLFPQLKHITVPFYYGCSFNITNDDFNNKIPCSFIYSSFPNRGLLELLELWPEIYKSQPKATLNIYSDVDNKWSNDVEPEKMSYIRNLLKIYKSKENQLGINYHGWVNKNTLKKAWESADIWFYPCTFMETFCLTALEAACTKTFVITNDLAALTNTVGDRGIIIKGDPRTIEWKKLALEKILYYMDKKNNLEKKLLIDKNYTWAKNLTWENQANKLLNQYVLKNNIYHMNRFDLVFDNVYFNTKTTTQVLDYYILTNPKIKNNSKIKILDIYTYTGTNLINFIKKIPNSIGIGIDNFEFINCNNNNNYNNNLNKTNSNDMFQLEKFFKLNMINSNIYDKTSLINKNCLQTLIELLKIDEKFDFVYIGLNNDSYQLYTLITIGWDLLDSFGIMGISYNKELENIINLFIHDFKPNYKILNSEYNVWIEKII